jgi:Ca-activated chloride channel family protein
MLVRATTPALKVKTARELLRRWPDDLRLALRLFGLLEELGEMREARRLAAVIRENPYTDASARTLVGEFYLRQRDEAAARRAWSEIVEFAPYDPYARRWLGDLYRAAGWYEDAYRQYETLQGLTPDDDGVLLLLASAAAGAGRVDEALRLEARVARSAEPGYTPSGGVRHPDSGNARLATLLSGVRLAGLRMAAQAAGDPDRITKLAARSAQSGALRDAGALRAYFVWSHPDAGLEMWTATPGGVLNRPEDMGGQFGIEAWNVMDLSAGPVRVEIRRPDPLGMRTVKAELWLVWNEGQPTERIEKVDLVFDRQHRVHAFAVDARTRQVAAPEWSPAPPATLVPPQEVAP